MADIVNCEFWKEGVCQKGFYGGRPSASVCMTHCPIYLSANGKQIDYDTNGNRVKTVRPNQAAKSKTGHIGLGDTVTWAIEKVSFGRIRQKKGCGCAQRQSWLNRHFPYRLPKWMKKGQ